MGYRWDYSLHKTHVVSFVGKDMFSFASMALAWSIGLVISGFGMIELFVRIAIADETSEGGMFVSQDARPRLA